MDLIKKSTRANNANFYAYQSQGNNKELIYD